MIQEDTVTRVLNWISCFCIVSSWYMCFLVTCKLLTLKSQPVSCLIWHTCITCVKILLSKSSESLLEKVPQMSFKTAEKSSIIDWCQRNAACCTGQENASQISATSTPVHIKYHNSSPNLLFNSHLQQRTKQAAEFVNNCLCFFQLSALMWP